MSRNKFTIGYLTWSDRKKILIAVLATIIFVFVITLPKAKYEYVKNTRYGYWGVKKIDNIK